MQNITFSGSTERELLGQRVEATEFLEAGIYHRTVYGTLRGDQDGLYIEDAEISYGFRIQRFAKESGMRLESREPIVRLGAEATIIMALRGRNNLFK
jgi:hypothetical protein